MGLTLTSAGGSIISAINNNVEAGSLLLKKATNADKDLVTKLLPANPPHDGKLDIRA